MLTIDHSARTELAAAPARCLEVLAAVGDYPRWASLIGAIEVLDERSDGSAEKVRMRAELFGLSVVMDCTLDVGDDGAVLERLPYDASDPERYLATWRVAPEASGSVVTLHVVAAIDAPGPARVLRGRVARGLVEDLLADFARAV
jgi:polyketide cyclase/dehydrase/lipid transport protein